ncbi:MAG: leucine-rich repeat domain-containing protein [Chlamydiia bacterium]|nr:leucine-rich repeat domain-containing protein [Chlamydiia bacterium]
MIRLLPKTIKNGHDMHVGSSDIVSVRVGFDPPLCLDKFIPIGDDQDETLRILFRSLFKGVSADRIPENYQRFSVSPDNLNVDDETIKELVEWRMRLNSYLFSTHSCLVANHNNLRINGNDFDYPLSHIPDTIGNFTHLQRLSLCNNTFTILPDSIGQLSKLNFIQLNRNNISKIPMQFLKFKHLTILDLSDNNITDLSETLGKLNKLEVLRLNGNRIETIPTSIGKLKRLRELSLTNNELSSLPNEMGKLKALHTLSLSHNLISMLPASMKELSHLQNLHLSNNPIITIPPVIRLIRCLELLEIRSCGLIENDIAQYRREGLTINI